jgi:hypothetical protein
MERNLEEEIREWMNKLPPEERRAYLDRRYYLLLAEDDWREAESWIYLRLLIVGLLSGLVGMATDVFDGLIVLLLALGGLYLWSHRKEQLTKERILALHKAVFDEDEKEE